MRTCTFVHPHLRAPRGGKYLTGLFSAVDDTGREKSSSFICAPILFHLACMCVFPTCILTPWASQLASTASKCNDFFSFFIFAVMAKVAGRNSDGGDSDKRTEFKQRGDWGRRCHDYGLLSRSPHPIVVSRSRSNWLWNEGGTEGRWRRRVNELRLSSELGPLINRPRSHFPPFAALVSYIFIFYASISLIFSLEFCILCGASSRLVPFSASTWREQHFTCAANC